MRSRPPTVSSSLVEDPSSRREEAARAIRAALEETGCFTLRIEGAGLAIATATRQWRHLYAQPLAIKQSCQAPRDEGNGWLRLRDEPVYMSHMSAQEKQATRCKEQFGCASGETEGCWPDERACPGFRRDISACEQRVGRSARALLGSFEALLGQHVGFLRHAPGYLTLTSYPGTREASELGLQEHSDAVVFTMLRQTRPALEIRSPGGDWLRVPVLPDDAFLVIPGDWMELFTNGQIPAVRHRVRELANDREAVVYFQNVARMPVGPLEAFISDGDQARYPTVDSTIPYAGGDSGVPRWQGDRKC